ncbi:energy-coupling factor transporter transmembrane component T family protein [Chloroflexota bacterium]
MISFRYRDKGTAIHKLNPFCKLGWVASIFVLALIFNNPLYLLLLFLSTLPLVITARVWREWASLIKFAFYLCLAIIIINALVSSHGSYLLWQAPFEVPLIGAPVITLEAVLFGVGMSLRLLAIISAFAILTFTTHPDDLMLSMIKMKLPYKSVLVTSLTTRFIPTLIDDVERISDVQRSRGLELDRGKLVHRIKSRMAIIIPLLSNSLDRTVQVAEAMEARAFSSGAKRTFYHEVKLTKFDVPILILSFLPLALGVFMWWWGQGDYQYYPTLEEISFSGFGYAMLALLVFLLCAIVPLASLKKRLELD